MKKLIINADDYGMTLSVSRGILKCAGSGLVRSVTAITSTPAFEASMDELSRAGVDIDIGFHANLTWGCPVLGPQEIPSLVDVSGKFRSNIMLLSRAITRRICVNEVYRELKAQFIKLQTRVGTISHIDGHHHVHAFPIVRDAVEKLAKEFSVPYIRAPFEGLWSPWGLALPRRTVLAILPSSRPKYWRGRGFETSDSFGGFALGGGREIKKRWLATIKIIPDGVTEIMVHPGYSSAGNDKYNLERESEIDTLTDPDLLKSIKERGIEVVSMREIYGAQ